MLVYKLHDGDQLFQPVFKRRTSQHHGIGADDSLEGACGDGVPVLDALCLIGNHQVWCPLRNQIGIALKRFVVGDLAKPILGILGLSFCAQPVNHLNLAPGKACKFTFPLVLERCRAHHQHPANAKVARKQLSRSDRLDCLAQTHFITNQAAAHTGRKQSALGLIRVELGLEQLVHGLVFEALRVGR